MNRWVSRIVLFTVVWHQFIRQFVNVRFVLMVFGQLLEDVFKT